MHKQKVTEQNLSIIGDRIVCNLFKSRFEADTRLFILLTTACVQMMFWLIQNHAFNLDLKFDFTKQIEN